MDGQLVLVARDRLLPTPVYGVELEQMGPCVRPALDLVHVHELEIIATPTRAEREAPNAAKAVDTSPRRSGHASWASNDVSNTRPSDRRPPPAS